MKTRIHVTKEDIQETRQGDPHACMVWRAVTRNLQLESQTGVSPVDVAVQMDQIVFTGKKGTIITKNSERTARNISKFDSDRDTVEPFAFDLDLPDDWRSQVQGDAK